jgi:hypothetical protein
VLFAGQKIPLYYLSILGEADNDVSLTLKKAQSRNGTHYRNHDQII